ncbi:MAG: hypothetical protein U9Q79_08930, partial [Candidatus Hydrogenedentes bacterium]|nr:hypothetical protein [Candidatus Hydrogenedentota bacterium]
MPANPEPENPLSSGVDDPIFEEMERIDGAFLDSLDDRRLESGVPEDEKADDEEFLRMSGLTYMRHDKAVNGLERPDSYASRLDEEEFELADPPLSFYEKGVADVDTDMAPEAIEAESSHAADTIPAIQEPSSIAGRGDLSRHVVGDPQAEEGGPSDEEHAADEETDSGDSGSDTEYVAIADEDAEETGTAGGAEEAVSEIETMSSSEQSVPPAGNGISLEQETRAEFFNDEGDDEDHDDELLVGHEEFEAFVGPGEEDDASGIQWDEAIEESAKVLVEKTEGVEEILDAPPEATTEGELAGEQGSDEGEIEGAEPPPDI